MSENVDAITDAPIDSSELLEETVVATEPESSPEPVEKQEEKNTDAFQDRINKVTSQKYEQQRRGDRLEAELQTLKAATPATIETPTPLAMSPPVVPEDLYDSEARAKYDADMVSYNRQVASAEVSSFYEKQQKQVQEAAHQAEVQKAVTTFADNAIRDGVDMDKLGMAEKTLVESGITPELGKYLMNDQHGGKIVEYLHDNPAEMHELLALDPISAGIKIEAVIKTKALSKTPLVSNAPDPIPSIAGGGSAEKDDFERSNPGTVFI